VAVTVVAALSVTVQVPVPEHAPPLQPVKLEPAAGAAVKVTAVPLANAAAHVVPQEMPAGLLVTVPLPAPALETVNVNVDVDVSVTVKLAVAVFPAASRAVTVSTFTPVCRVIPLAVQLVVPVAVPLPPRSLTHVTCVTPIASDAVPPSVSVGLLVLKVGFVVGAVMVTVGAPASAPLPDAIRETVSPFDAKVTFAVEVAVVVGLKRTVTVWVVFSPTTVKGLPDTMLNGAGTDAVPDTVPPTVFCTVTVWSAKLPRFTVPKFTVPVGLTAKVARATALATDEQALSMPPASTAVIATK
jgi:hypothetical protein